VGLKFQFYCNNVVPYGTSEVCEMKNWSKVIMSYIHFANLLRSILILSTTLDWHGLYISFGSRSLSNFSIQYLWRWRNETTKSVSCICITMSQCLCCGGLELSMFVTW
jgi:hypothetical protein